MGSNRIDTIFFDLDGTLVNPRWRLYRLFIELTDCKLSYDGYWKLKDMGFNQSRMLREICFSKYSGEEFSRRWLENVEREDLLEMDVLFGDVAGAIAELKGLGIKMHVVTNRQCYKELESELQRLNIRDMFEKVISTFRKCTKADAIRMAGIEIGKAIFVGDSAEDMDAALHLGISGVLIERGPLRTDKVKTDFYIRALNEMNGIILEK